MNATERMCSGHAWRVPSLVGLLLVLAAPLSATPADTLRLPVPEAPDIESQPPLGRAFWERVRAEARRFLELEGGARRYAERYRISPELARTITEAAREEGIDPELAFRVIHTESRFHPRARGPHGALGLMQVMPSTARRIDRSVDTHAELFDPRNNLRVGMRYLRRLLDHYDGDVRLALLAYNRGEGRVDSLLRRGRNPENGYSRKVLGGRNPYRGPGVLER